MHHVIATRASTSASRACSPPSPPRDGTGQPEQQSKVLQPHLPLRLEAVAYAQLCEHGAA